MKSLCLPFPFPFPPLLFPLVSFGRFGRCMRGCKARGCSKRSWRDSIIKARCIYTSSYSSCIRCSILVLLIECCMIIPFFMRRQKFIRLPRCAGIIIAEVKVHGLTLPSHRYLVKVVELRLVEEPFSSLATCWLIRRPSSLDQTAETTLSFDFQFLPHVFRQVDAVQPSSQHVVTSATQTPP